MSASSSQPATDLDKDKIDYEAIADPGHGNTVAAWTGVFIMLFGGIISLIGNILDSWPVFFAGFGVAAVGLVVGYLLRRAGKGRHRTL
ncbi:HGxxPAAW family protein [Sediminivirga luteola]|uniref:Uncharacterized protein n=1 Tax=Sediminivirga luteola TaxID=1774748 RepID=A0A8J2TZ41_9MICO|nr:HGxxPAAW family protein [Sediminivirga luteola]MCI2264131.1 hypothetical protein [Sediminivirga luteola]GGA17916.1 hypothetical protein GCM10011333_21330 [Sediminivirga luteola]